MGNKQSVKSHMENAQRTGVFQLTNAKLTEVPLELFKITTLRSIDLSTNRLRALPPTIGSFANLRTLMLNSNQLTELPDKLTALSKLEVLSVASNQLTSVPPGIAQLASLRSVNLADNRLRHFPLGLASLRQLDFVDLSRNSIEEVPEGVAELQACELNLNQNQLSRISDDLARCPRLKVLRVDENCLPLAELERAILPDSNVSLLACDGNLFDTKQLHESPSYDQYMERYTATKKKM